jgi:3-oxoacyl-[acyl-carrier protein] reductase
MSRKADIVRLVEQTVGRFGALHILVANAGICPMTPLEMISEEEWDQVLTVNLKGTFLACQAALPHLRHAGKLGRVVILSSIAGQSGGMSAPAHYAASKAGLLGLTKLFAQRLAPDGVTVNCVSPATVESDLTSGWSPEFLASLAARIPLGRLGKPEEVAAAVCYLASDSAAFITGATLDINGGVYLR